jgi:tetratricopeptide (TPR) repeat protein
MKMEKGINIRIAGGLILLVLVGIFGGIEESWGQQENPVSGFVNQFLQAVVKGDSAGAFELCSSGLRRGKTAEGFLQSPEIASLFSGAKSWEIIGVSGKDSMRTAIVRLTGTEGGTKKFRTLGIVCLNLGDSYRVRDFSLTPWVTSEARSLRYLSDLYERLNDMDSAERAIQKAFALDPKDPKVYAFLGYIYLEKGINQEEANRLIQSAHEQDPSDPEYMDFLGWAYHKADQRQKSVQWFDKAREAFQKVESYESNPEYIRFTTHVEKGKARGWKPTPT